MKKKYVLLTVLLTAVVVGPFAYQRWSEANRLRRIQQTKQQAAQIDATPLSDFLNKLGDLSPEETVLVLYTGNTQAHLEPCGCYIGQSGGLPRRATAISRIKESGFSPLLVDLGGVTPTEVSKMKQSSFQKVAHSDQPVETSPDDNIRSLDRLRVEITLTAMASMGYDVLVPSEVEANFGPSYVIEVLGNQSFSLLAANLQAPTSKVQSFMVKTIGHKRVGLIGLSTLNNSPSAHWKSADTFDVLDRLLPQIQGETDSLVIFSNLPPEVNREIASKYQQISAILSHETGQTEWINNTLLSYSSSKGKTLGALILSDEGDVLEISTQQIALTEMVTDDTQVRSLLEEFYKQVADEPQLQGKGIPRFSDQALERAEGNAYMGSESCKTCHQKEFQQWSYSSHATAFNTLLAVGRHFYPECVSCHVTGFGYDSGYKIGDSKKEHLSEIGCETCHGPGKQHVYNPLPENIRGNVGAKICADCHTADHSPGFDLIVAQLMPEVDHSRTQPSLKTIIEQRMRGPMKPEIELFVMAYCSFAVDAEKELLPFLSKYGDAIDFKLRFIAEKVDDEDGELKFTSLRGETELIEDLRQLVISELYADKLFDYLLCRANHLQASWTKCAEEADIDIGRVARETDTEATKQRFLQEIRRTEELGITGSPTLVIDGREISGAIWRGKVASTCQ